MNFIELSQLLFDKQLLASEGAVRDVLNKYELATDRIYFDSKYQITLYFGDAKAKIGGDDYLDEKVMKLKTILPELEGKKGTLHMENYSEDMQNITFELE